MESVLLYILGILIVVVGIAVSIGLHEMGHLIPAKKFGVHVGQYMIGFGPTLFSRKRGETEYGLKAIPLGGYISMSGMYPPARPGGRARTATTGLFETLVQDDAAQRSGTATATLTELDGGEIVGESRMFYNLPVWKRIIIMLGGPFMNLVIAVVLFGVILMGFGIPQATTTIGSISQCVLPATATRDCTASDPQSPAQEAGLQPGDTIVSLNGQKVATWDDAVGIIRKSPGEAVDVVFTRDGAQQSVTVTPISNERYVTDANGTIVKDADGKSMTEQVGFLGIGTASENVRQPITAVLPAVGAQIGSVANIIFHLPQRMVDVFNAAFGSQARDPNGPVSVVGVGRIAGEITSLNTVPVADRASALIGVIAGLNVALFVFNLIPLPPLDGGHIAVALIDAIRRFFAKIFRRRKPGPIDAARIIPVTLAVTVVLGAMSLLLIYADIVNPITLQ